MTEIYSDMERVKKTAKPSGNSSRIYVPKDWEGDEILAINLDSSQEGGENMKEGIDRDEIEEVLFDNIEEIIEKLWYDEASRWKFWIHGKDGSDEIKLSSYVSQNTQPNPENYDEDDWLIQVKTWNDIAGVSGEKIEEWKEEEQILEAVQEITLQNDYVERWANKAFRL